MKNTINKFQEITIDLNKKGLLDEDTCFELNKIQNELKTLNHMDELKKQGYTIIRDLVSDGYLSVLSDNLDKSFKQHRETQLKQGNDINVDGVALHTILSSDVFLDFLANLQYSGIFKDLEKHFFGAKCILNSFSGLNNLPNIKNFSAVPHRDLRFYSGTFPTMVNLLVMIDDFTIENGGTYLLPKSHLVEEKPSDEYFFSHSIQATGRRGDILVFDSNVFHASAPNKTNKGRKAIPITISRSFMKQLVDYPRAIGYDKMDSFSYEFQQLLGYHSRVPASLEEWYQPEENRFYKKNQD